MIDWDKPYHCQGFVLRTAGRDEFAIQHSSRATLFTEVDLKALEFLLYFAEPCELRRAVDHFRADEGWEVSDDEYESVMGEMIAGFLLRSADSEESLDQPATPSSDEKLTDEGEDATVQGAETAPPSQTLGNEQRAAKPAHVEKVPAGVEITQAGQKDVEDIVTLRNRLMENVERTIMQGAGRFGQAKGGFHQRLGDLTVEGRALLFLMVSRMVRSGRKVFQSQPLKLELSSFYESFVPYDDVLPELIEYDFVAVGERCLALNIPDDEVFPIFETLFEEFHGRELDREWRLPQLDAESLHLVARQRGDIVGYLGGLLVRDNGVYEEAEIKDIIVAPSARNQGVGAAMVRHFQKVCADRAICFVKVPTQRMNERAIRFYERMGFRLADTDVYLVWYTTQGIGPAKKESLAE